MSKNIPTQAELVEKIRLLEEKAHAVEHKLKGQTQSTETEENLQSIADTMSLLACNEDILLAQFEKNLVALQEYFPEVYDVVKDYQPSRYFIEIVDGFANIFDEEIQQHIYQYPAYLMATAQLTQYQQSPQSTHSTFEMNEENRGNFIHSTHLNEVLRILTNRVEQENSPNKGLPETIGSLVLFGAGAGYHIELLINQHKINNLYIIEPEIDLFYASLYTANWQYIFDHLNTQKCNLHLSLGVQDNEFFDDLLYQTYQNGRYDVVKTFGYVHYHSPVIEKLLGIYKSRFYEMIQGWGFFDDGVMSLSHTLSNLKSNIPLLKKSKGQIINIGSTSSYLPIPGGSVYAGSKFAVRAITDALRLELKHFGISVSLVSPGAVESEIWNKSKSYKEKIRESIDLQ
ncbi:MAG: SDR family NAD(P)-dependent oxidoreductase, partial [Colwellia sp.]|nr:SDR family NAD(P)-dependent oxidoreductase [Colwellia sp.]